MPLRTRLFILITAAVLVILAVSIFLIVQGKKSKDKTALLDTSDTTATNGASSVAGGAVNISGGNAMSGGVGGAGSANSSVSTQPSAAELEANNVIQLAKIFTERYGSYSTDNNYQNIKEVKSLSTGALWQNLNKLTQQPKSTSTVFIGVTTKVITSKIIIQDSSSVQVDLSTLRTEDKIGAITSRKEKAQVFLVKSGSSWLVDKFVWQ